MDLVYCDTRGFPIRKSAGRWIFAPNRSLSQLITSFVGSQCQGILLVLFLAWPLCLNLLELFEIVRLSSFDDTHKNFSHSVSFDTSLLSQCISSIQFSKYNRHKWRLENSCEFSQIYLKQLNCLIQLEPPRGWLCETVHTAPFRISVRLRITGSLLFGGLKWTRTTDLTLIRRAL